MKSLSCTVLALATCHAIAFVVQPQCQHQSFALSSSAFRNPEFPEPARISSSAFASRIAGPEGGLQTSGVFAGERIESVWDKCIPVTVQGGALRTWSFLRPGVERVQILLRTEGRPLNANIELWNGPDNTPQKVAVYLEDGNLRPFSAVIETPRDHNAVAIYNTGHLEFPLSASVEAELSDGSGAISLATAPRSLSTVSSSKTIQGGAIQTIPFSAAVESIALLLRTDGRPLNARVELLQGPNTNKQIMEVYTEDGLERPFFAILETPGVGNVVRICNTATVEFPLTASVEPYSITPGAEQMSSKYDRGWDESARSFYFLSS